MTLTDIFRRAFGQRKFNNTNNNNNNNNKVCLNFNASQNQLIRENFRENILDTNNKIMNGR